VELIILYDLGRDRSFRGFSIS